MNKEDVHAARAVPQFFFLHCFTFLCCLSMDLKVSVVLAVSTPFFLLPSLFSLLPSPFSLLPSPFSLLSSSFSLSLLPSSFSHVELKFERYKFIVQVVIGEQRGEGVKWVCAQQQHPSIACLLFKQQGVIVGIYWNVNAVEAHCYVASFKPVNFSSNGM